MASMMNEKGAILLGERVAVKKEESALLQVDGTRRFVVKGDPQEDWWVEVDASGKELPGDWEYWRDKGVVVCMNA